MSNDRDTVERGIGNGPNSRPLNDGIAGTGPGIPDDALAPGEDTLPEAPSDGEVADAKRALGVDDKDGDAA